MNFLDPKIEDYARSVSFNPSPICAELADYTRKNVSMSIMLTGPMEAAVLGFLIRLVGAKRVLEFGTYTGYSALAMAENLPEGGEVVTLDINPDTVNIGKRYWEKSPHGKKINSILGPALETVANLKGPFDFAFIDAVKSEYPQYLEHTLRMLSPGGMIAVDNTLYSGMVLEAKPDEANARAMKVFNEQLKARKDLFVVMLPIRDGITLIQKV